MNKRLSKYIPKQPVSKQLSSGVMLFSTLSEALNELTRRVHVLGQAEYLYEGLALRMQNNTALSLLTKVEEQEVHKNHKLYIKSIDVAAENGGFCITVPPAMEKQALAADIGTKTVAPSHLWGMTFREEEKQATFNSLDLAAVIAQKALTGESLRDTDVDSVLPMETLPDDVELKELRNILAIRDKRVAEEEKNA